jgi:hypothetical protein
MFIKLTDTQLAMLSVAAQREDRCLVALPKLKGGAVLNVATKLVSAGFVEEVEADDGAPIWRRDNEMGRAYALKLTAAGANAIGLDEGVKPENADNETGAPGSCDQVPVSSKLETKDRPESIERVPAGPSPPRGSSKLARVIELLQRDDGATIDELIAATGWLAHTTRAALTGLRKRGYPVAINRTDDRGSFYRINVDSIDDRRLAIVSHE